MTRRRRNNQWSGGIAAHPTPKISACKIPLERFSPRYFEGHFEGKTPRGHQGGFVLAWQSPDSPNTCNPEETGLSGLPMSWSPTLFTGSDPVGLHLFPRLKKQLQGRHFSSDAEFIATAETWLDGQLSEFFWVACKRHNTGLRSVLNFVGSMLKKSRVWSL